MYQYHDQDCTHTERKKEGKKERVSMIEIKVIIYEGEQRGFKKERAE